jgi:NADH-quinone oxidoreductase subunit G
MPRIIIDGQEVECRDGISVLQAGLEAGWDIPHYCYHPRLSVTASCRLCLMEMKLPHPQTGEMDWAPKLFPSCQTPVKDGLEVRFDSEKVKLNQKHCLEYLLLNHPLDCPVCDQAGECYLQDYSERFGWPAGRMVDRKTKAPKKDLGPKTLLYADRCVMCTRCVRFTEEISGTHELCVVNRGTEDQIDVFPGYPLDNKLQGNVVNICPVGALVDKDFLFKQRVWLLRSTASVCPGCATGCSIHVDANEQGVWRLRPRFNRKVNDYWMCDEGRFGWKYIRSDDRIRQPSSRRGAEFETLEWSEVPAVVNFRLKRFVAEHGGGKLGVMLSPMSSCEEAWLLAGHVRALAPEATLSLGPVPTDGEDEVFPVGGPEEQRRFTISKEKCPNRKGLEMILAALGGATASNEEFAKRLAEGELAAAWVVGGYPFAWASKELVKAAGKADLLILQDLLQGDLAATADIVLPFCAWTEREGSFVNGKGLIQTFDRAQPPVEGAQQDGQYLWAIAGHQGLYCGSRVREMMVGRINAFNDIWEPEPVPEHQH